MATELRPIIMSGDPETYRQNNDELLTGEEIVALWADGNRTFRWMGRVGGMEGDRLRADLISGRWRNQDYEVRRNPLPDNPNWFPIGAFVELAADTRAVEQPRRTPSEASGSIGWASSGRNAHAKVSGQRIYDQYKAGTLPYSHMGRTGGREGPELRGDIATDRWRTQQYEVRRTPISGNRNWFTVSSFVNGIDLRQRAHDDPDARWGTAGGRTLTCAMCFLTKTREQFASGSDICIDCAE